MFVAVEDARVHGAEHLFGGGRDGAVAEGLERQDGEGLLDLDADLVIVLCVTCCMCHSCTSSSVGRSFGSVGMVCTSD